MYLVESEFVQRNRAVSDFTKKSCRYLLCVRVAAMMTNRFTYLVQAIDSSLACRTEYSTFCPASRREEFGRLHDALQSNKQCNEH